MKKLKHLDGLVTQSLEHISKEIFSKYSSLITQLVEKSSGVYALYDEGELYYVGRATQLRTRVKQHLKDKHMAGWTHFSVYLVGNNEHIGDIESLLVRIANPKGNAVKPKGKDSRKMQKQLEFLIKQKHKDELDSLFSSRANRSKKNKVKNRETNGLVDKRTPIYRTYKGKDYKAILTPNGTIIYKGKKYDTPTGAGKAVAKRMVNGWYFWFIKDRNNNWVKLTDYK
jgi:hypothetical protein